MSDIFVSPAWLKSQLGNQNFAILDASWYLPTQNRDARAEYEAGHIPHAVHFDLDIIRDTSTDLPHMLPAPQVFAAYAGAMGLSENMTIVVYDGVGLFSAPRVRWMLNVFGAKDVRILMGGLPAWKAAGYALAQGQEDILPRTFTPHFQPHNVASFEEVKEASETQSVQIVDARSAERFEGSAPEPRAGLKAGHIPNSKNLPFGALVKDGTLGNLEVLQSAFEKAGVDLQKSIITTCGSGVTAAIVSLSLEVMGHPAKALYDGSWAQWGGREDALVATGL
jgi:thiosulfate/3-mercaptopyruvate sulfurtransferase